MPADLIQQVKMVVTWQAKIKLGMPNEAWSMDFVSDQLANGMKFRTLTIVDGFNKEALATEWQAAKKRARSLRLEAARSAARRTQVTSLSITAANFRGNCYLRGYYHQAPIDFSRPGKPTDKCHIETLNGSFQNKCLNLHWFDSLIEAKAIIATRQRNYQRESASLDSE